MKASLELRCCCFCGLGRSSGGREVSTLVCVRDMFISRIRVPLLEGAVCDLFLLDSSTSNKSWILMNPGMFRGLIYEWVQLGADPNTNQDLNLNLVS